MGILLVMMVIGAVLETVWRAGGVLQSWGEYFKMDRRMDAFKSCGVDPAFYAYRERQKDELLPWDVISMGVRKEHLWHEREQSRLGLLSPDCRKQCTGCGAAKLLKEGKCDG